MPLLLALIGLLVRAVGPIVAQVLLSLGITFLTYTGIDFALDAAKGRAFAALSSGGQVLIQLVGVMQIGTALNIIFSAYAARMILNGITNGGITKMITKA